MNTTILEDKPFQKHITHNIKETRKNYDNMFNQILWEICRIKIKEESIAYCKQKQIIKNARAGLEKQISETEEKIIATNYNNNKLIEKNRYSNPRTT